MDIPSIKTGQQLYITYFPCTFNEVLSIHFNEDHTIEYMSTLYGKMYIKFFGVCPKTAPSQGYSICKYVSKTLQASKPRTPAM